jgi:alpha-galactosidase/6-phospho-beta-glucosidase family protein
MSPICRRTQFLRCQWETTPASLAVDATVSGDHGMALQTLLLDPCLNDLDMARTVLDAYLVEYEEYLPQF